MLSKFLRRKTTGAIEPRPGTDGFSFEHYDCLADAQSKLGALRDDRIGLASKVKSGEGVLSGDTAASAALGVKADQQTLAAALAILDGAEVESAAAAQLAILDELKKKLAATDTAIAIHENRLKDIRAAVLATIRSRLELPYKAAGRKVRDAAVAIEAALVEMRGVVNRAEAVGIPGYAIGSSNIVFTVFGHGPQEIIDSIHRWISENEAYLDAPVAEPPAHRVPDEAAAVV